MRRLNEVVKNTANRGEFNRAYKAHLERTVRFTVHIAVIIAMKTEQLNGMVVRFMMTWKHVVVKEKALTPDSLIGN